MRKLIALCLGLFIVNCLVATTFVDTGAGLSASLYSATAWGDYDNDGDLDFITTGYDGSSITKLYRNDNGIFTDAAAGLPPVYKGSVDWGDYDNDGDLDLLITGNIGATIISRIYRNNGNSTFTDIVAGLTGVYQSSATWGDCDNDGDLDILLIGASSTASPFSPIAKIYINTSGAFASTTSLTGVYKASADWGDYDNDGDLDIVYSGATTAADPFAPVLKVYRNDSGTFTNTSSTLTGVCNSSLAWGDYDNDGDLDLLTSGYNGTTGISKLYRNNNGSFVDSAISLTGLDYANASWGDYDNDGDQDILLTGKTTTPVSKLYNNDGGTFSEVTSGIIGVNQGSASWGDYDNDGDLDLLVTGASSLNSPYGPVAKIYRNDSTPANNPPSSPINLRRYVSGSYMIFQWDPPLDDHNSATNLTYVLRIGTTSGGNDVLSGMASSTGYRRNAVSGYGNSNCTWKVLKTKFNSTSTFYWSVQAIDGAFKGSAFATQKVIPRIQILSPNGGETWNINESKTFYWANNPYITSYNIFISYNNGSAWTQINSSELVTSAGSYTYTLPSTVSSQCLIKVVNYYSPYDSDVSDAVFNIVSATVPKITLTAPDTATLKLVSGKTTNITWTSTQVDSVKIELTHDGGYSWSTIAASLPASLGTYSWTIPDMLSEVCYIRISDKSNTNVYDWNNNSFRICLLRLLSPNGGNLFMRGQTQTITWVSSLNATLRLEYSDNNGSTWTHITNPVAGTTSYAWPIPTSYTPSNLYLIRISDYNYSYVLDTSDTPFTVSALAVTYPSATGIRLQSGKTYNITWSQQYLSTNLKLEYTSDGTTYTEISSAVSPAAGSYAWTVPGPASATCKVRVSLAADLTITDTSDNSFSICSLLLTAPNGGGVYNPTATQAITWTSGNVTNVKLEYTTNNGTSWTTITASVAATPSTYNWTIPTLDPVMSSLCRVRVSDTAASGVEDTSDNVFTIRPPIMVIAPNGGEFLSQGSTYNIRWSVTSNVTFVKIDYFNGSTWNAVVATDYPANEGTYAWTVPTGVVGGSCKVRVKKSGAETTVYDDSDAPFTITPIIFPPTPQFVADNTEGLEPFTVNFTDQSTPGSGSINYWLWNFGDNTTSLLQNPTHIYQNSGVFSVSLTVKNVYDSTRSVTRSNYITVNSRYPRITLLTEPQVTFENENIGEMSDWIDVQFQNIGLVDMHVDSLAIVGLPGFLYQSDTPSMIVPPGGIETVSVKFAPQMLGDASAILHIYNDSSNNTDLQVGLLGSGMAIRVPSQYSSIQAAINAANEGNCIIVEDGVYYENLQIVGKQITLASNYYADGDTMHVYNTIIDGSQIRNPDQASVLAVLPGNNPYKAPRIIGFTLRNGRGWKITETMGASIVEKRAGGGIYIKQSNPVFTRNLIVDNDAEDEGGGSYAFQSLPNMGGIGSDGFDNPGGNIFLRNRADIGKDMYINATHTRDEVPAENCKFEVFSTVDTTLSAYWATTTNPVKYSGSHGSHEAINADLYVATDGNNSTNTGLTPESPFLSIDYALSLAYGTPSHPITIHLASGIYSSDFTGEKFPLQMVNWVSLKGNGIENTIIDAGANSLFPTRVMASDNAVGIAIEDLTLINGYVTNAKNLNGGGLACINSHITLSRVAINNSFSAGDGAGFYAYNSEIIADSLSIEYNQATGSGGGIFSDISVLTISNSVLSHNLTAKYGGGIYHNSGQITLTNNLIQYNNANGIQMRGGGINLTSTSNPVISNNTISSNSGYNGGGISMQNCSSLKIINNKIVNNVATNWGGGLYHVTSQGNLYNNLIANNTASQRGGGLYSNSSISLTNCTISNNRAYSQGGAIYSTNCTPSLTNSILWNDSAPSGSELYLYDNSSSPSFRYCDVEGGVLAFGKNTGVTYDGVFTNNLNVDPLFTAPTSSFGTSYDALSANWALQGASPCVNLGDPTTSTTDFPLDLAGLPRVISGRIDMGAYESVDVACAIIVADPGDQIAFPQSLLNSALVTRSIAITNSGTQPLIISGISLSQPDTLFQWTFADVGTEILPEQTVQITVTFNPAILGNHSNTLLIQNNSLNLPVVSIDVNGSVIGETSSEQGNIHLTIVGYNALLSWDPITLDENGNPFTPDEYLVLYSESADVNTNSYIFHGSTADTTYTHHNVARYRNKMFYRIVAVSNIRHTLLQDIAIRSEQNPVTWGELKRIVFQSQNK